MAERDIQHAIRIACGKRSDSVLWRNNVGVALQPRGDMSLSVPTCPVCGFRLPLAKVAYGLQVGSGDLIGISNKGRFISIEIKAPGKHSESDQVMWANLINKMGGLAGEAHSPEEAYELLDQL